MCCSVIKRCVLVEVRTEHHSAVTFLSVTSSVELMYYIRLSCDTCCDKTVVIALQALSALAQRLKSASLLCFFHSKAFMLFCLSIKTSLIFHSLLCNDSPRAEIGYPIQY